MKFSVMTAIFLIAPNLALASPGAEATPSLTGLHKLAVISAKETGFDKKPLRSHVIERPDLSDRQSAFVAYQDLCNGPTKMLRHACIKGEGASGARDVTGTETPFTLQEEPNRRQSYNSRQTSPEADLRKKIKPDAQSGIRPMPGKPVVKPGPKPEVQSGIRPMPGKPVVKPEVQSGIQPMPGKPVVKPGPKPEVNPHPWKPVNRSGSSRQGQLAHSMLRKT